MERCKSWSLCGNDDYGRAYDILELLINDVHQDVQEVHQVAQDGRIQEGNQIIQVKQA